MKILKVILFVVGFLVLAIFITAIVFLKTFDLNKYLPQLTQLASQSLGREVVIASGDLNLGLAGISLDLKNITIADDKKFSAQPFVTIDTVHLGLDIVPLLTRQQIAVTDIVVQAPKLSLVRSSEGLINAQTIVPLQAEGNGENLALGNNPTPANQPDIQPAVAMPVLLVKSIIIEKGTVSFVDKSFPTPLIIDVNDIKVKVADFSLTKHFDVVLDGIIAALGYKIPLSAQLNMDLNNVDLKALQLTFASGTIVAAGELKDIAKVQSFKGKVDIAGIKVEELADQKDMPVGLKGVVAGTMSFSGEGFEPQALYRQLKGAGELSVSGAVVERFNILKSVLGDSLNAIPGLAGQLDNLITQIIKDKTGSDTIALDKAYVRLELNQGVINLKEAAVNSKVFDFMAQGTLNYQLETNIDTIFLLSEGVSQDIASSVKELAFLKNDKGRIEIKGKVSGLVTALSYKPDVNLKQVATNALVEEGVKQLDKVIEKNPEVGAILDSVFGGKKDQEGNVDSNQQPQGDVVPAQEKTKKIISDVLGNFLK